MRVSFNFDTGARRVCLIPEDPLEEVVLKEMAFLSKQGVHMKLNQNEPQWRTDLAIKPQDIKYTYEIEMRINGFDKEKKAE